jgi:hypothetical protein
MLRVAILFQVVLASAMAYGGSHICLEAESSANIVPLVRVGGPSIAVTNRAWSAVKGASADMYIEIAQSPVTNSAEKAEAETKIKPKTEPKTKKQIPGKASFDFDVSDDGEHYLWCRVWWFDTCGNSVRISIDGARPFSFGQDGTFKRWHWFKAPEGLKQLKLEKGSHSMVISAREDGIRIDQILLTDDSDFVPVGKEDVTKRPEAGAQNGK